MQPSGNLLVKAHPPTAARKTSQFVRAVLSLFHSNANEKHIMTGRKGARADLLEASSVAIFCNHFSWCLPSFLDPAHPRKIYPALVRWRSCSLDDLHVVLSGSSARRIRLRPHHHKTAKWLGAGLNALRCFVDWVDCSSTSPRSGILQLLPQRTGSRREKRHPFPGYSSFSQWPLACPSLLSPRPVPFC
jgi:hypothetical protein